MIEKKRDTDLDLLVKAMSQDSPVVLDARLEAKKERVEAISRLYFSKSFKFRSETELARLVAKKYGISQQTARSEVELCKMLYVYANPVDWKFERALLLYSIKQNINKAREGSDLKTVQREHKNLIEMMPPEDPDGGARVLNINVINYNPTLIGAVEIPDIDKRIKEMIEKDKQQEKDVWDDYEEEA